MSINRFAFALSASENERYLIRKGVDMLALLRALAARTTAATLYFGEAEDRLESRVLAVNPAFEELVFSTGSDPAALDRLLAAGSFGVETALDSIRTLFIAEHAERTQFGGQDALRARIPDVMARMQRRESVRVAVSPDKAPQCSIPLAGGAPRELRLRVLDVSTGGLGLECPTEGSALAVGKLFTDCTLELPGIGLMRCTLGIVYSNEGAAQGEAQRVGCRFVDLPALSREQVRSYVARLERAHLAQTG